MEVPDAMISDAIKKKAGYTYYMAKKVESEKAKIVDQPKEQHVSPIKSGRGKGFMCYGDQVENFPNKLKKYVVTRKTRSLTIAKEAVVGELENSISIQESRSQQHQRSQLTIDRQTDKAITDLYNEYGQKLKDTASDATLYSSSSDKSEESANEADDADKSDMDLFDYNPQGDDDVVRYGVFMHNKSTSTPNSTYLSLAVTSSSLDLIQTLLDDTPANELRDCMSHPVYTDAHTTSVVHNPEGNPELTSYISGASENNDVELEYHVSKLKAAVLSEAQWNSDERDVSKPRSFKRHISKSTKPHPCFYNSDYTYLVDISTEDKYTTSITKHYVARYYKEVRRSDDKEYEFSYADLPRLSVNDVEDMYLLQVQDKLHHLPLEFVKNFNNALLMFIKRM
uniref:Uncharacterized protein n=1 Tax=Tanacetum cinerariifolium TaxID=118510 RepID=A0A6L2KH38_TANCI|nr:hypothetical protein CTI12_AA475510 [Tanacetum cinerariifolium]